MVCLLDKHWHRHDYQQRRLACIVGDIYRPESTEVPFTGIYWTGSDYMASYFFWTHFSHAFIIAICIYTLTLLSMEMYIWTSALEQHVKLCVFSTRKYCEALHKGLKICDPASFVTLHGRYCFYGFYSKDSCHNPHKIIQALPLFTNKKCRHWHYSSPAVALFSYSPPSSYIPLTHNSLTCSFLLSLCSASWLFAILIFLFLLEREGPVTLSL